MTIREIAQQCGVSRGTVDRVINGRGRVNPETEALIRDVLAQVGYTKNIAGRALTVRKMSPVIGVVLSSEGNPFFDEVIAGIRKAEADLTDYGVSVELVTMRGYDTDRQLSLIDGFVDRISALVFQAINDARIATKVDEFSARDIPIPVVTVNTDIENSARLCYVGSDYIRGGETAAGVVGMVTGGQGQLGMITGAPTILGHEQRREAFERHLQKAYPGLAIVAQESARDDIQRAYQVTAEMLARHPFIDTLMIIAAGLEGVCQAVIDAGLMSRVRVFGFDSIPKTEEMMRKGLLKAVVCQQPYLQGYQAVRAAYDIILTGKAGQERLIMENQIKILENLLD